MEKVKTAGTQLLWHTISAQESIAKLNSNELGVTQSDAIERLKNHGPNRLPQTSGRNPLLRFFSHFHNILIYVLIGSAIITALLEHWIDSGVILTVVIANAIIGYIQEGKAEQAMNAIRHMLAPKANVIRDGERITIDGENLVPGDIVLLEAGDKVPADLRLFSAHNAYIQEAILTGESVPVEKNIQLVDVNSSLGDRSCMAFSGTLVTSGQCKGVVVATGPDTEIGRISGLLNKVETLTTPLVTQMGIFAKWLTVFILVIAALLIVFGTFVANYDFTEMFMAVVGLSVAAIPEGLPAVLTITLAIGVQAMARRNAIVRRLPAIETLGSVSVICTDKTGTLTRNEMMVSSVLTNKHLFTLTGNGYEPRGTLKLGDNTVTLDEHSMLEEIARASTLCNDAALREVGDNWTVEGDPMEGALLAFAGKMDLDIRQEKALWTRTDAIPFDAKHRFMATLNHDHEQHAFAFIKGAPEQILAMCENQRGADGSTEPLDKNYWNEQSESIAALGQRVLAFAVKSMPPEHSVLEHQDITGSITLLGLVGMIDPPRQEAIEAVAECHRAGIQVKMITGDHTKTAAAIGKQIGLHNLEKVLTGADLDQLDDTQLRQIVLDCDIFARTSPEHKLRLVMALQSHGMTVAMTGDGVNDAPALKRADAGIAMGQKGSEAAKEAADLVLADDNFSSIVAAVAEGRTVYDNLKKVISWTLPTNAGEAMTIIVALLMGMTLPVTPIQILWINLVTAITLGVVLAFEPTEEDTMQRPPRSRNEPLLNAGLIWHVVLVSLLFLCGVFGIYQYAIEKGYSIELARTIALNTLVVMEIFHLFFIRNIYGTSLTWKAIRGTKFVWSVILAITLAQFAITYLKPLQAVFDTVAIPFWDGLIIVAVGVALFTIIEIEKQLRLAFTKVKNSN
ncbi:cation-transporting P-type ATPase [Aliiglaciecola sp. 2_MG-2023]|uniref:cation-transporting P-type ATPase n=1 Tax=unclassified Aliiglaciecola TaxID=2593648 RepID=UPI0026E3D3BE|nr:MULTISPECIES: cation-transporting P-type ATPase [unclassified Aliiglaciecola]MDO6710548.1 cation-transporting P-type ATPase [Aliiglaciecola sp. 2_MG-2023]MDO6751587.1 cation-transporting P-type ATPase [Aliiglaciecola sp. 1_MG-2023]